MGALEVDGGLDRNAAVPLFRCSGAVGLGLRLRSCLAVQCLAVWACVDRGL